MVYGRRDELRSPTRDDHRIKLPERTNVQEGGDALKVDNTMDRSARLAEHLETDGSDLPKRWCGRSPSS
jgi:hypothetical protein